MSRRTDSQRGKVYAAEQSVESKWAHELDVLDGTTAAAQAYVDAVLRTRFWKAAVRRPGPVSVEAMRGRRGWAHGTQRIRLGTTERRGTPASIRSPLIILHELAHIATPGDVGHGQQFAAMELRLVRRFLGDEVAADLRAAFTERGVRWRKPPSGASRRTGNPEALAAYRRVADGEWIVVAELLPPTPRTPGGVCAAFWRDRSIGSGDRPLTFYVRDYDSERLLTSTARSRAKVWKMRATAERWAATWAEREGDSVTGWRVEPLVVELDEAASS